MPHAVSIDREKEIALFNSMLAGNTKEQILLVNAKSGWGKSFLLREFASRRPQPISFGELDFKGGGTSLAELFSRLSDKLGGDRKFPKFHAQLHDMTHPSLSVTGNTMIGKNRINIYLGGRNEQEHQTRLSVLTDAFFSDLRALDRVLLIFDTYEQADESIQKWLSGAFLSRAYYSPNLYTVIGGQKIPESTIEWGCENISLIGIPHEHWYQYAQSINATIHFEYIRGICEFCQGHPLKMKKYIDSLVGQGN